MYPYFMGLFSIGCLFLFLAIWFLPFIVVAPRKCANLINIGSICIIASLAIIKGTYQFLVNDLLCNKTKWPFAWLYVWSIIFAIYSSMISKNYILTIISLVMEITSLIYLVCSYFPGGTTGMKYMLNFIWLTIKKSCSLCMSCLNE